MFVWEDHPAVEIRASIYSPGGAEVLGEFTVSTQPPTIPDNVHVRPEASVLANGNVVVAWSDFYNNKARILDQNGNQVAAEFQLNQYGANFENQSWAPDIVPLADGGFVGIWSNGAVGIRARVFDADGTERVPEFDVSADIDGQFEDRVRGTQLDNGKIMLVWEEMTEDGDGSGTAIEGRIFDLPSYDYETGKFISVGSTAVDDLNGILVQDVGQNDVVYGLGGNDVVDAGDGNDIVYGDGSNDTSFLLSKTDQIAAKKSGGGKDKLDGGDGKDKIFGGDGNDKITGGEGKDKVKGGKGNDKFIFAPKDGKDTITDFGRGKDKLHLKAFDFKSKSDALDAFKDAGKHTTFKAEGTKIKLKGFDYDDLGGGDLIV